LKADRLLLYAQRIAPLRDLSLPGGYELLLRLREMDGSLVAPGPLIDAAQRYQLLPSIDRWVVKRALEMLAPYRGMLRTRALSISSTSLVNQSAMRRSLSNSENCLGLRTCRKTAST
jgi:EAL domain-containing protein (putative c-di-GMP-specific phosphodiesterase class I)